MYKNKEKQRQANREAQKRFKDKQKGITSDRVLSQGITCFEGLPADVRRSIERLSDSPEEKATRTANAIRYQRLYPDSRHKGTDTGSIELPQGHKPAAELKPGEFNRVSKPGDQDYQPSGAVDHCECGTALPQLEQPRQHPGKCLSCVMGDKVADVGKELVEVLG